MRLLFDHGTPAPLRFFLAGHTVKKAKDLGWGGLSNGELLRAAEEASFEILLTTDKNIRYQQNLVKFRIAILQLSTNDIRRIRAAADIIRSAIAATKPNEFQELVIP